MNKEIKSINNLKKITQEVELKNKEEKRNIEKRDALEDSKKIFKKLINESNKENIGQSFTESIKPLEKFIHNNELSYNQFLKECLSSLSKEEKTKFCDLFLEENTNQRKDLIDEIKNQKIMNFSFYPLDIDFLNNKNTQNSKGETIFEVIAKNQDSYKDNLENFYSGYNDPDLSEPNYRPWKNLYDIFSLSIDNDFSKYLLEKYGKSYNTNDKNINSTKVLDFAMDNMGELAKNEFKRKIESYKDKEIGM